MLWRNEHKLSEVSFIIPNSITLFSFLMTPELLLKLAQAACVRHACAMRSLAIVVIRFFLIWEGREDVELGEWGVDDYLGQGHGAIVQGENVEVGHGECKIGNGMIADIEYL